MEHSGSRIGPGSPRRRGMSQAPPPTLFTRRVGSPVSRRRTKLPDADTEGEKDSPRNVRATPHTASIASGVSTPPLVLGASSVVARDVEAENAPRDGVDSMVGDATHPVVPPVRPRVNRFSIPAFLRTPVVTSVSVFAEDDADDAMTTAEREQRGSVARAKSPLVSRTAGSHSSTNVSDSRAPRSSVVNILAVPVWHGQDAGTAATALHESGPGRSSGTMEDGALHGTRVAATGRRRTTWTNASPITRARRRTCEAPLSCLSAHRHFINPALTLLHTFLCAVGDELVWLARRHSCETPHGGDAVALDASVRAPIHHRASARLSGTLGSSTPSQLVADAAVAREGAAAWTRRGTHHALVATFDVPDSGPTPGDASRVDESSVRVRPPSLSSFASMSHLVRGDVDEGTASLPYYTRHNGFCYDEADWFSAQGLDRLLGLGEGANVLLAVTAEPPVYVCGMLLDPVRERFLFGGTAFREEARVLRVVPDPTTAGPSQAKLLLLLREYFTVCQANGGFLLQTFSLLSSEVQVVPHKQQLLAPEAVQRLLLDTYAGAVTRVFALREVVSGGHAASTLTKSTWALHGPTAHSTGDAAPHDPRALLVGGLEGCMRGLVQHSTVYPLHGPGRGGRQGSVMMVTALDATLAASSDRVRGVVADAATSVRLRRWAAEQDAAQLVHPTDTVRVFLRWYSHRRRLAYVLHAWVVAVRRLQRFLRGCLQRKRRAVQRMLRLWRQLEMDARQRLQHYRAPASTMERVDLIAGNLLQQHMLTTREYKLKLIEELWGRRRAAYRDWRTSTCRSDAAAATSPSARTRREDEEAHAYVGWYMEPDYLLYESHHRLLASLKSSVLTMETVEMELQRMTQKAQTGRGRRQERVAVQSASSSNFPLPLSNATSAHDPSTPQTSIPVSRQVS